MMYLLKIFLSIYLPFVWSSTAVFPAAVACFQLATKIKYHKNEQSFPAVFIL